MKGTYVLVVDLDHEATIEIGSLGELQFPAGCYAYVGSAQAGIEKRVARHKSKEKTLRWHIDYLLERGAVISTISIPFGDRSMECAVAGVLMGIEHPWLMVRGFGCSDCSCRTHLVYLGPAGEAPAALESLNYRLSTLGLVYPATPGPDGCAGPRG